MITIELMESSNNYNNHFVTIKDDDVIIFSECLIGFNNTSLFHELRDMTKNKTHKSIKELNVYGFKGKLENISILNKLVEYNKNTQL